MGFDIGNLFKDLNPFGGGKSDITSGDFWSLDPSGLFKSGGKKGGISKTQKQINKYNTFIRAMLKIQAEAQPQVTANERANATSLAGINEDILGPSANRLAAASNTSQRTADLADYSRLGQEFTRAHTSAAEADPLVAQLRSEAMKQLGLGSDMDPIELRKWQQAARSSRSSVGFGQGSQNDQLMEALALAMHGEDLRNRRLANAGGVLGATGGGNTDSFLAVTGRGSSTLPFTGASYGQTVGSSRFNPVEQTYSSDLLNQYYAQKMNAANNKTALIGAGIGAVGDLGGAALGAFCWVAREVFGAGNPQWLMFRNWLLCDAPPWFVQLYVLCGNDVADYLRANPDAKPPVRQWMEDRIHDFLDHRKN